MRLSEYPNESLLYNDMPQKLPAFVMICMFADNQIQPYLTEKAAQRLCGGIGYTSTPKPLTPPNVSAIALAEMVAGYTGSAPMKIPAGR